MDGAGSKTPPLSLVSEIAAISGSAMGIAIANRKNRCDFGALSSQNTLDNKRSSKVARISLCFGIIYKAQLT